MISTQKEGENLPDPRTAIESDTFVTLLGGGECTDADIAESLRKAPVLVAADGGADRALAVGYIPEFVVGDFDSLSPEAHQAIPRGRLCHVAEQDSTDFEKALSRISAPGVLAVGFTGRRTDHELAAWHVLMAQIGPPTIVLGAEDIVFLAPPELRMTLPVGTRVSLFPMAPITGRDSGLRWPIEGLKFAPGKVIGTSNETAEPDIRLCFSDPHMLIILPKIHLSAAMQALFH